MTPFLVETLEPLYGFYAKFIRPDFLANVKMDVSNCANQLSTSKIDVGFSLNYDLKQLKNK